MFDQLLRELAARFNLGGNAIALLQQLIGYLTNERSGGLSGFLSRMNGAGMGGMAQSWVDKRGTAQPLSDPELESLLARIGGPNPLDRATQTLDIDRGVAVSALAFMLPVVVGKLSPGGAIPAAPPVPTPAPPMPVTAVAPAPLRRAPSPAPVARPAADAGASSVPAGARPVIVAGPPDLGASGHTPTDQAEAATGVRAVKWLLLLVLAAAVWFGFSFWSKSRRATPPPSATSAPATDALPAARDGALADRATAAASAKDAEKGLAAEGDSGAGVPSQPASALGAPAAPVTAESAPSASSTPPAATSATAGTAAPAIDSDTAAASAPAPEPVESAAPGSSAAPALAATPAATDSMASNSKADAMKPAGSAAGDEPDLVVYFGSGKTTVAGEDVSDIAKLAARLQQSPSATALVQGFSDRSGNAAKNAELARRRAGAVKEALVEAGVSAARLTLETPPAAQPEGAKNRTQRRVEVTIRN